MHTDPPVTVDVVQRVRRGNEQAFEALLAQIISTASTFEGYLGSSVFAQVVKTITNTGLSSSLTV